MGADTDLAGRDWVRRRRRVRSGDELYGPDWDRRSLRARTTMFGTRRRCRRCCWKASEHAHHVVRFHRRWAWLLDGPFLVALCDDCHKRIHRLDRRWPSAPLWLVTIVSILSRWTVTAVVLFALWRWGLPWAADRLEVRRGAAR